MIVYLSITLSDIAKQPITVSSTPYPVPDDAYVDIPYNHFYITLPDNIDPDAFNVFGRYFLDTSTIYPFAPCTPPDSTANPLVYCIKNETLTIKKKLDSLTVIIKIKDSYCDSMSGIYQFRISHYLGTLVDYQDARFIEKPGWDEFLPVVMDKNAYNVAGLEWIQQKISLTPGPLSKSDERTMYQMQPSAVNYASSDCHSQLSGAVLFLRSTSGTNVDAHFYKITDFVSLMTAFAGFVYGVAAVMVSMFFAIKKKFDRRKESVSPTTGGDQENQAINNSDSSVLVLKSANQEDHMINNVSFGLRHSHSEYIGKDEEVRKGTIFKKQSSTFEIESYNIDNLPAILPPRTHS